MATCDYCGKEVMTPFNCNYCDGSFCSEHRLPPNHGCPSISSWEEYSGPSPSSHEKLRSWENRKITYPERTQKGEKTKVEKGRTSRAVKEVEKERGWWSKKKITGIVVVTFLVLVFAHIYISFSNSEYRVAGLQLSENEVPSGEKLTATAQIKNIAETNSPIIGQLKKHDALYSTLSELFGESQLVTLKVDGKNAASKDVKIGLGDSENINYDLIRKTPGFYDVKVGSSSGYFQVTNTAKFELSNLDIDPSDPWVGEGVSFSLKVRNVGGVEDTKTLQLNVDGETKEEEITLAPGEEELVSFSDAFSNTGSFEAEISEGTDKISRSLSVSNPSGSPFDRSEYYYGTAESYVQKNYQIPEEKNIQGLADFLNQVELPGYSEDYFDCSESSSIVEWMLEGAGFHAELASNSRLGEMTLNPHTWVMVYLEDDRRVAIEATYLTSGEDMYYPPGIIEAPDGDFEYYSYESYFERRNPNKYLTGGISIGWSPGSQTSYSPEVLYETPKTPVERITTDNGYMGDSSCHYYMSEDEFDWWNVHPYSNTAPFSSWG